MNDESAFLEAMARSPEDWALRLIFADWLEEQGDQRHARIRILHRLANDAHLSRAARLALESEMRDLMKHDVPPVGPDLTNSIGMEFAWIPAGSFVMGSPESEHGRDTDETQHRVTLTRGYWMGRHLVTQDQWTEVMGANTSHFRNRGAGLPAEWISWLDCLAFCRAMEKLDSRPYRLPTEAEWEYACRGGTTSPFWFGDTTDATRCNYEGSYAYAGGPTHAPLNITTPGKRYPANPFGLYDMHGNLQEFCADRHRGEHAGYPPRAISNPRGPAKGQYRIIRGGSWGAHPSRCRSAEREWMRRDDRSQFVGFRVVFHLKEATREGSEGTTEDRF